MWCKGIAFIEFFGEEHAIHAKNQSADLKLGSNLIKVGYARPGYQKFFQNQMVKSALFNCMIIVCGHGLMIE